MMRTRTAYVLSISLSLVAGIAQADEKKPATAPRAACPAEVTASADRAFPGSKITSCKAEKANGKDQFEIKLTRKDGGAIELDLAPDGKLLQIEESIAVDKLPTAVSKAFEARYPKAKADRAQKQTVTDKGVFFEIAFKVDGKTKETTFDHAGGFIEEE